MEIKNIKIIGLGGIGSIFTDKLTRFMSYDDSYCNDWIVTLYDGDKYEHKNRSRQEFLYLTNKATSKQTEINDKFEKKIISKAVEEYINKDNLGKYIENRDLIFLCVDNHQTRKMISNYALKNLHDFTIVSGGNDFIDGNVQVFHKNNGTCITPSLTAYHPEIENPDDQHPENMSCEELSNSVPQLYFANLTVATIMCWVLYALINDKYNFGKPELYFDIELMSIVSKMRSVYTTV